MIERNEMYATMQIPSCYNADIADDEKPLSLRCSSDEFQNKIRKVGKFSPPNCYKNKSPLRNVSSVIDPF